MTTRPPAGVILAGGRGTRMGGVDKGHVLLAGRPLIAHVLQIVRPQLGVVAINANGPPERFASFGLPVLADLNAGFLGPLAGVLTGLRWAAGLANPATHVVFVPTDTPFLPGTLVDRLMMAAGPGMAMAESSSGTQQAILAVPIGLADDLEHHIAMGGRLSIHGWLDRHPVARVPFPDDDGLDPFLNVNTPEDLALAETIFNKRL